MIKLLKKAERKELKLRDRAITFMIIVTLSVSVDGSFIYKSSKAQPILLSTMSDRIYLTEKLGNINFHLLDIYYKIHNNLNVK